MFVFYHVKLSLKRTTFAKGDKSKLKLYVLHYVLLLRGLCTLLIQIKLNVWTVWVIFITSLLRCDFGDHCINHWRLFLRAALLVDPAAAVCG